MAIKQGDKIKVEYTGTLEDGTVFDSSEGKQPLEFTAGTGMVIPGFDKAVIGMKRGDEQEISIAPKDAYGELNGDLKKEIPRTALPQDQEPQVGMGLMMNSPQGQIPARISAVTEESITLDFNHPLAGKALNFKIKIADITPSKE